MKTLKTILIALAVFVVIVALGIISCTVQLARGVNAVVNEPSIEVKAAVEQTERAMAITPEAITITIPLVKNTQSGGYHAEIGIGQALATALGMTLEYKPVQTLSTETRNPDGSSSYNVRSTGGGLTSSFGSNKLSGSGGKTVERTAQSHYTNISSTATGSGIRLTLHYDDAVATDECSINGKQVKLRFTSSGRGS